MQRLHVGVLLQREALGEHEPHVGERAREPLRVLAGHHHLVRVAGRLRARSRVRTRVGTCVGGRAGGRQGLGERLEPRRLPRGQVGLGEVPELRGDLLVVAVRVRQQPLDGRVLRQAGDAGERHAVADLDVRPDARVGAQQLRDVPGDARQHLALERRPARDVPHGRGAERCHAAPPSVPPPSPDERIVAHSP